MTQHELLKEYLIENKKITPMEALNLLGIYRLSAVIYDLRKEGMNIETNRKKVKTTRGYAIVAEYELID